MIDEKRRVEGAFRPKNKGDAAEMGSGLPPHGRQDLSHDPM
ncbi:MAG: hypothetical protein ACU0CR_19070 [Sagittula sp.]